MINAHAEDDFCIFDISVISGKRPIGRVIDHSRNARRNFGVLCVWEGETTFYRDRQEKITVSAGQAAFIPKHEKYTMKYTADGTAFVVVNFDISDPDGCAFSLLDGITVFDSETEIAQRIIRTMIQFERCGFGKDFLATVRKKELAYHLFGMLYTYGREFSGVGELNSQIASGVRLLEETYLDNLPISAYAAASHVSVNTFRRAFQKHFGISPLKYRNKLRIERAKELLAEGDTTVGEAAYAAGFDNVGYFCRYYRREVGETPSETKNKNR